MTALSPQPRLKNWRWSTGTTPPRTKSASSPAASIFLSSTLSTGGPPGPSAASPRGKHFSSSAVPTPSRVWKTCCGQPRCSGRISDFQLLVIGCGNRYMGDWWQAAGHNGENDIKDRIIYAGPVEHEKMYLYYNAADLCVIPSYYESFCMTALESVACGTPVLATRVGEIPEISRLSSLCKTIPDNNPDSLARHISILLQGNRTDSETVRVRSFTSLWLGFHRPQDNLVNTKMF